MPKPKRVQKGGCMSPAVRMLEPNAAGVDIGANEIYVAEKPGDVHHVYLRSERTLRIQSASVQFPLNRFWLVIAFAPARQRPG